MRFAAESASAQTNDHSCSLFISVHLRLCPAMTPKQQQTHYLMVAATSFAIAASWGAHVDQSWLPLGGKSK
jgi:hypothetical protein